MSLQKFELAAIEEAQELISKSVKGTEYVYINVRLLQMILNIATQPRPAQVNIRGPVIAQPAVESPSIRDSYQWPAPQYTKEFYPLDKDKIID